MATIKTAAERMAPGAPAHDIIPCMLEEITELRAALAAAPAQGALTDAPTVGAAMANVMFNFAQKAGYTLTSDDVAMFAKLRKQWDATDKGQVSDAADAAMWRALVEETNKRPCLYSCLRDDLHDWISDYAAVQAQAGDEQVGEAA